MICRGLCAALLLAAGCTATVEPGSSGSTGTTTGSSSTSSGSSGSSSSSGSTGEAPLGTDYPNLALPQVGDAALRVLSPTVLELSRVTTKAADPAPVGAWDFVDSSAAASRLPAPSAFAVTVNGQAVAVSAVGFKRRPIYAPIAHYDLRIGNALYLQLASAIPEGAQVSVENPDGSLWQAPTPYHATSATLRYSPAIHVDQLGYAPALSKKAMVGYYLGSLGELPIAATTFALVDRGTGESVFTGALTVRADQNLALSPAQYQQVYEADFSSFQTPGEYQLTVPGLGASYPFRIDDGTPMAMLRTYAAGLYNQRCGMAKTLPYTRFVDGADHTAPASIPTMDGTFDAANALIDSNSAVPDGQTAPQMVNVAASLYPFVKTGTVDVSGGHHDAGDYSKYVANSAKLIHVLTFAADDMPGVGALDNLGIPESGDGKSDVLQEAKWEADFLVKMQDTDGAFYTLVYPRDRAYEQDVLPSHGDPQIVWPKTTLETAAAVGALAELGSSPLFSQQFPTEAARYLQAAQAGWTFLQDAISQHGRMGSYQYLYQYGSQFLQDDELDWAAAAMFAATGDAAIGALLQSWLPDPNDPNTFLWGWWRNWEGYGSAIRDYAFAARSGRLQSGQLDASYLAACEAAIASAANDQVTWASQDAYGTSFPQASKAIAQAGWYFSPSQAFDIAVAQALSSQPGYQEAILTNFNYELGANPLNMSFVEGVGFQRPREMVSQFFQNDRHRLPPTGIEFGNLDTGFAYLDGYGTELGALTFPRDGASQDSYAFYDRFGHSFNVTTEAVTMNMAWALAAIAETAAQSPAAATAWTAQAGALELPASATVGTPATVHLSAPGIDLSAARVTWEAADQEPSVGGTDFTFTPTHGGAKWVEAEAMLPDGRRVVAVENALQVVEPVPASASVEAFNPGVDLASDPRVLGWFPLDGSLADARGAISNLTLAGSATLDSSSFTWTDRPGGGAMRFFQLGDQATATFDASALAGTAVSVQAMLYINKLQGYAHGNATLLQLYDNWNSLLTLQENEWTGLEVVGGQSFSANGVDLAALLTPGVWHHVSLTLDGAGYALEIDGVPVASTASGDLANWSTGTVTLTFGNLDGWVDEVIVERGG